MSKKIDCPVCNQPMVWAMTDDKTYKERAKDGTIIEVVHVYFGCTNEKCGTTVRLRFRKDGKEGDLWRSMKQRKKGIGKPVVTDFGGAFDDVQG